jgi:hypothetical protein
VSLKSIFENTTYPLKIILVDNASTEHGFRDYVENLLRAGLLHKVIWNPENMLLKGWFPALREIEGEIFAISDPDIVVPSCSPCWLKQSLLMISLHPEVARLGLSLRTEDVPGCWSSLEAKKLSFKSGRRIDRNGRLRIARLGTTMQLIRRRPFDTAGGFSGVALDHNFWSHFRRFGLTVAIQDIEAVHLGWREYIDYKDYLRQKDGTISSYREVLMIREE